MSESPAAPPAAGPVTVPIRDVDRALLGQLHALHGQGQALVFRARLSNLVVFCNSAESAERAAAAVPGIVALHPARVLLLIADPGTDGDGVTAAVQMRQHAGPGGRVLCSEEVTLRAGGQAVDHLPFAVRQLLIGDLPTNLWWAVPEPPGLAGALLHDLAEHAQQLVYDSIGWREPARGVAATASWLKHFERRPGQGAWRVASDLNWRRLKYWRRLVGQALDPASAPGAAESVTEVVIEHGPHAVVQAWELVSWLVSRLGWRVHDGHQEAGVELTWQVEAPHGALRLVIRRLPEGPPEIVHVRLGCTLEGKCGALDFVVEDQQRLAVRPEGTSGASRTVTLQNRSLPELVARQLSDREYDPVFEESMAVAQVLARSVLGH